MSILSITPIGITSGIWSAVITGDGTGVPQIAVTHDGTPVPDVQVTDQDAEGWLLQVPIPPEAIADGVQTFVISDQLSGDHLTSFTLLAGEVLGQDIRAEVDLLRAELDLLKRAFRRHCIETT